MLSPKKQSKVIKTNQNKNKKNKGDSASLVWSFSLICICISINYELYIQPLPLIHPNGINIIKLRLMKDFIFLKHNLRYVH